VEYVNGLWVAGCSYNNSGIFTSDDGKTWTRLNINFGGGITCIKYANDMWVAGGQAVGTTGSVGLWWSLDGKTWTQGTGDFDPNTTFIEYANGIWVTGGQYYISGSTLRYRLNWSEDGKTWSHGTIPSNEYYEAYIGAYYSKGLWLSGTMYTFEGHGGQLKSTDGKTWTTAYAGVGYPHKDNGRWLVFGSSGIEMEIGARTNNVSRILDWLLYAVDNLLN
jgi:hypothetical protein